MKKIIFIICISLVIAANAQYDTLPYNIGIPNYFMNHSFDSMHVTRHDNMICIPVQTNLSAFASYERKGCLFNLIPRVTIPYLESGDFAFGFYPDSTVRVVGIAWVTWLGEANHGDSSMWYWDTIEAKIFIPNGNRMTPLVKKKITRDTFSFTKIVDSKRGWNDNDITQYAQIYNAAPLYEVYFDNEYNVSDSIYLSVKFSWTSGWHNWEITGGWRELHPTDCDDTIHTFFPVQSYRMKNVANDDAPWTYGEINAYPLLFPIIRRDCDSCPEVHELRYTKVGNSAAIVQWDAGANHSDWQLCYGTPGFDPDGAEATTIRVPQRALTGLSATAHYDVYVKARCQFDRSEYSPWAGPFDLCLSEIGIDGADAVEAEIGPNPTNGMLTVRCEAEIKAVELYDMQGRCVANGEVGTASGEPRMATLQVQHLPAGTYTAVVRTAQGTATKQVVVL